MSLFNRGETAVFALGGLGEVGKNMYCIEQAESLIIIDAGVKFPEDDLPGIDYVIPNYDHLVKNQYKIKALLITHGHEDHIGGIHFLLQKVHIPVIYAPRLAAALIRHKLEENRVRQKVNIIEIDGNTSLTIDDIKVDFFATTHSIPDTLGISFTTPNGRIVTTGDFKIDLTPVGTKMDLQKIAAIGSQGVTLLLSDSTNAEVEGHSLSEKMVVHSIHEVFRNAPGRLIIATFASNIHRIQQIVEAAVAFKRKILIVGRSMERTIMIGRKYGYIRCPDSSIITPDKVKQYRSSELMIICTGSQGEPLAALSRIANGTHRILKTLPGDTVVFSSSPIPGNTQSINRVVNALSRQGADVLTNSILTNIHASGHASKEELKYMISLLQPKYFMPIHGEYHMLKIHGQLAESLGIPKQNIFTINNGNVVLVYKGECRLGQVVETDDIYVDGKDSSGLSTAVIRDRKILASDGVITVLVSMDSRTNSLLCPPQVLSRGFMYLDESKEFSNKASTVVEEALLDLFKGKVNFQLVKNIIRSSLSAYIFDKTNRSPMIIPVIMNRRSEDSEKIEAPSSGRKKRPKLEKEA